MSTNLEAAVREKVGTRHARALRAAVECFEELGYDETTTAEIARRAGRATAFERSAQLEDRGRSRSGRPS